MNAFSQMTRASSSEGDPSSKAMPYSAFDTEENPSDRLVSRLAAPSRIILSVSAASGVPARLRRLFPSASRPVNIDEKGARAADATISAGTVSAMDSKPAE